MNGWVCDACGRWYPDGAKFLFKGMANASGKAQRKLPPVNCKEQP